MANPIEQKSLKYYGNYRGKVISTADPQMLGRIKIEVYPMFTVQTAEEKDNLPWAVPAMPLSTGAGVTPGDPNSYWGTFAVPNEGTMVWVFFEAGDPYQPVYFAEATDGQHGIPGSRISQTEPEDYPQVRVMRTKNGIQIKINDALHDGENGDHRDIRIDHPSGSWAEFYPDGKVTVHTSSEEGHILLETDVANINLLAKKGDITAIANEGDIEVVANEGDIEVRADKGNIDIKTEGNEDGEINITAQKGDIKVTAVEGDLSADVQQGLVDIVALLGPVNVEASANILTLRGEAGVIIYTGANATITGINAVISAQNVDIIATNTVDITAPQVNIN